MIYLGTVTRGHKIRNFNSYLPVILNEIYNYHYI